VAVKNLHDVIVVGAGPSGIFAILELLKNDSSLKILVVEKGKDIDERGMGRCRSLQ
jgi:2-polyprenyl-6-methoxyphenol hydroxylase-like FAD-dependent oxidoreductase